ncbi:MAG TPA: hypothetical protein VLE74_01080 [Candidatus Saccharimonadales bacterium]|nr:hypothetical protein [Candidatus Saccharimonadales bacterium]
MVKQTISTKRIQIDKANAKMVIMLAATAFVIMFSVVASHALLSQHGYQARVIKEKKKALVQLKVNNQAVSQLVQSYKTFAGSSGDNVIGGNVTGSGDMDGNNAKIVLDALPSKYDFPALATSLDKILANKNFKLNSITGTDDELNQGKQTTAATAPIEIPFQVSVTGTFDGVQNLLDIFDRSIRPIKISQLGFKGTDTELTANVTAKTYFQPEKKVQITTKVVK